MQFTNTFNNIITCGDTHGDIMPLVFKINDQYKIENSLIIIVGDVGIGFYNDGFYTNLFKKAAKLLEGKGNILLFLRGNHDDPEKWNDYEPFKAHWKDSESNIRFVKDYTVILAKTDKKEYSILCVGGALSVDRTNRTPGKNYWVGESFIYDESKVENLTGITDVITHSCPDFCEPILKIGLENWMAIDKDIEVDCTKERQDHTLLYNKLKEKNKIYRWHYGHMHFSWHMRIDDTLFRLLDIMELSEI